MDSAQIGLHLNYIAPDSAKMKTEVCFLWMFWFNKESHTVFLTLPGLH